MNHIAVIYDGERVYGEKLAEYFNASGSFPFETRSFYKKDEFERFCLDETPEVLIVDENFIEDTESVMAVEKMILSSTSVNESNSTCYIYKYQEVEKIIRRITFYLSNSEKIGAVIARKNEMKIISFYSPVKRSLSTTLAIGMGQMLAKRSKTLYINLECYAGLEKMLCQSFEKDVTDLMYFIESKGGNVGMALSGIVQAIDGIDILPPAKNQSDLISVTFERWKEMFERIERDTDYEYVLVDLSEAIQGLYNILDMSDYIVTCVDNDEVAISKIVQYENGMRECGLENILNKTKKCNVPHQHRKNGELRNLLTGELGNYINNVLQGILNEIRS